MARPTKLTDKTVQIIVEAITDMKGRVQATREAGIHYSTFLNWMENNPDFSNSIKKAEEEALERGRGMAIMTIFQAMKKGIWTAAAWWLERNFDEYALKTKNQLSGPEDGPIRTEQLEPDFSGLSPEERLKLFQLWRKTQKAKQAGD